MKDFTIDLICYQCGGGHRADHCKLKEIRLVTLKREEKLFLHIKLSRVEQSTKHLSRQRNLEQILLTLVKKKWKQIKTSLTLYSHYKTGLTYLFKCKF